MRYRTRVNITVASSLTAVLLTILFIVTTRCGASHEDGYSVGTLINVRQEGALWARPAATLLHTGEMKGDEFALDDNLFALARTVADRSARVRVEYIHRYVCWAWNYASCNIITKIEEDPIEKK
jgi:hypothetical protein